MPFKHDLRVLGCLNACADAKGKVLTTPTLTLADADTLRATPCGLATSSSLRTDCRTAAGCHCLNRSAPVSKSQSEVRLRTDRLSSLRVFPAACCKTLATTQHYLAMQMSAKT